MNNFMAASKTALRALWRAKQSSCGKARCRAMRALELNPERVPARALPIDLIAPWLVNRVGQRDIWRDALQFWQARVGALASATADIEIRGMLRAAWLRPPPRPAFAERVWAVSSRLIRGDDRSYYTFRGA
jgi:hypothetical protein